MEESSSIQCDLSMPKSAKKKRFSDEQIKSLEIMFESETKLDKRMKLHLAKELSLQPRQVAIWFQNRRARWKTKQIEKDYSILRANYDVLALKYESLKTDNQSLMLQLQKLNDLPGKPQDGDGEEAELLNIGEAVHGILTSQEDWCSYDSTTDLIDHSCKSSSKWWEIWP